MTDTDLIRGCINGDRASQKALYQQFCGRMYTLCQRYARNRMEAQDFLQEGFIRVFSQIGQFRNEGSLEGWIRRIMVNTALKHFHRIGFQMEEQLQASYDFKSNEADCISSMSEKEIIELIGELPDGYRVVFNLYVIEGYSHKEIGIQLRIAESTSRSQLVKARNMLQMKIKQREKITS